MHSRSGTSGQRHSCRSAVPAIALLLPLLAGACSDPLGANVHDVRFLGGVSALPAWSLDSRTIYYTTRSRGGITEVQLMALDAASGEATELASVPALNHGEQVRTTDDPEVVYVSIAQPNWTGQLNLYEVPASGGAMRTIATNLGAPWFVVTRDGSTIAYQGSQSGADTIYVASTGEPAGSERFPSTGQAPRVISLSPSGGRLVYASLAGLFLTHTDGSAVIPVVPLSTTGQPATMSPHILWSGEVPHLLVAERTAPTSNSVAIQDLDAVSGARTELATLPRFVGDVPAWQLARTGDGSAFAAWVPIAVVEQTVERTIYRYRLYVSGRAHAEPLEAMELTADEPLTWFEFSPDGRRLALVRRGFLYLVNVE